MITSVHHRRLICSK